ncbi:uncharacterized protein TNCT_365501 [Trichonephila clavata]|uniref:Uncharacterized protein n=1 Tax=Trichonephila clavata TaxID=2740835 RepID=A0A8X6I3A6_TRICU|nr:uncharacterized protein TNCT_365501 [Trichonephila clavata]
MTKQCWERKRMNAAERINDGVNTSTAGAIEIMQVDNEIASILTPDCRGTRGVPEIGPKYVADTSRQSKKKFCDNVPDQRCLILITVINAQTLVAHSEDISFDSIINRSDYLEISETWMEDSMPMNVPGFDLRSYCNTAKLKQIASTSSVAVSSLPSSRKADGVAIYRNINSFTDCNIVNTEISKINLGMKDAKAADVCLVNAKGQWLDTKKKWSMMKADRSVVDALKKEVQGNFGAKWEFR